MKRNWLVISSSAVFVLVLAFSIFAYVAGKSTITADTQTNVCPFPVSRGSDTLCYPIVATQCFENPVINPYSHIASCIYSSKECAIFGLQCIPDVTYWSTFLKHGWNAVAGPVFDPGWGVRDLADQGVYVYNYNVEGKGEWTIVGPETKKSEEKFKRFFRGKGYYIWNPGPGKVVTINKQRKDVKAYCRPGDPFPCGDEAQLTLKTGWNLLANSTNIPVSLGLFLSGSEIERMFHNTVDSYYLTYKAEIYVVRGDLSKGGFEKIDVFKTDDPSLRVQTVAMGAIKIPADSAFWVYLY